MARVSVRANREYKELFNMLKTIVALKGKFTEDTSRFKADIIHNQMEKKFNEFKDRFLKLSNEVRANSAMQSLFQVAAKTQAAANREFGFKYEPFESKLHEMEMDIKTGEPIFPKPKPPSIKIAKKIPEKIPEKMIAKKIPEEEEEGLAGLLR